MEWNLPCRFLNESDSTDDNLVLSFHEIVSTELSFVVLLSQRKFRNRNRFLAECQGLVFTRGRQEVMKEATERTTRIS